MGQIQQHLHPEGNFFIDNLLVRMHFVVEIIWWTGLAPWEFQFPFPGNLKSTFLIIPCSRLPYIYPLGAGAVESVRLGAVEAALRTGYSPPKLLAALWTSTFVHRVCATTVHSKNDETES